MSGIAGVFHRDGRPVTVEGLSAMRARLHAVQPGGGTWVEGPCGLAHAGSPVAAAPDDGQIRWLPGPRLAFVAVARLDGRDELGDALDIAHNDRAALSDEALALRAYLRWGESVVDRLLGDWAFAAWHADDRRLFVARDPLGTGTLYTFADDRHVAFASSLAGLLALPVVPTALDELHLARMLTAWPSPRSTIYAGITRLPHGHALAATGRRVDVRRSVDFGAVSPLRLAKDDEYVEAARELLTRAVADRLRTSRSAAVALSGGLDSSAVAATAGRLRSPLELAAIAHVPQFPETDLGSWLVNEAPLVAQTAAAVGIARVTYLDSAAVSPLSGIRRALPILGAPTAAAANQFWLLDLLATAREQGHDTLLTGQLGNLTISWRGIAPASDWRMLWRSGERRAAVLAWLPAGWRERATAWRRRLGREQWRAYSAIRPEFARRLHLADHMDAEGHDPAFGRSRLSPLELRVRMLSGSRGEVAETGVAHGVTVSDPTADVRLVRFCLSLPETQFLGPRGETRWLVRRAMAHALPPEILWNPHRGRQAGDLPRRLALHAAEVDEAIAACELDVRAREYLDVPYLRATWRGVRQRATAETQHQAVAILMRGLMAGLFLAGQERRP